MHAGTPLGFGHCNVHGLLLLLLACHCCKPCQGHRILLCKHAAQQPSVCVNLMIAAVNSDTCGQQTTGGQTDPARPSALARTVHTLPPFCDARVKRPAQHKHSPYADRPATTRCISASRQAPAAPLCTSALGRGKCLPPPVRKMAASTMAAVPRPGNSSGNNSSSLSGGVRPLIRARGRRHGVPG